MPNNLPSVDCGSEVKLRTMAWFAVVGVPFSVELYGIDACLPLPAKATDAKVERLKE